jgi:uncharacterized repeat protein (TIGR01451 family)
VSRLQSRRHIYYYLEKYFKLVGIAIVTVTQVTTASAAEVPAVTKIDNTADYAYEIPGLARISYGYSNPLQVVLDPSLDDPAGKITGCQGETLPNYEGFVVSLYETPDGLRLGNLVNLTASELPDLPGNGVPPGIDPNRRNNNPFALTSGNSDGRYNFLLDATKGQLVPGHQYILVIKPPSGSIYTERQILLTVVGAAGQKITIRASSLDGKDLDVNALTPSATTEINAPVEDLTANLSVFGLKVNACNPQALQIIKSADRAAAEPGDTIIYRLLLKNLSTTPVQQLSVTDTLPLGFRLQTNIVKAKQDSIDIPVNTTLNGNVATFNFPNPLDPGKTINLAYATTLTPDAVRGTGKNSATLSGLRTGKFAGRTQDGPAIHQLQIRQGILADTGTIIGRVFVDKNFDGEQQPNEPGVPNAVIFLDDGNKITTDANGMFSVKGANNGYRTGVLDLSSLPGYTLAPNLYFKERNSQSRLVKLAPSGLVRMNFGVTPTAKEAK